MSTLPRLLNVDDLEMIPDDGKRYELIAGELTVSPAPSQSHQWLHARLMLLIGNHVVGRGLGEIYSAPVDVRFSPVDQVQPDLLVLFNEQAGIYRGSTVSGAPDLVVEIISPSSRTYDEAVKFGLYERNGVPEYWIADPIANTIRQFVLRNERYVENAPLGGILRSVAIPDLTIDLATFFAELEW
jgi:Uma2 family endonuclease